MVWQVSKYILLVIGLFLISFPMLGSGLIPDFETSWLYKQLSWLSDTASILLGVMFLIASALLSFFSIKIIEKRTIERNAELEREFNQSGEDKSISLKDDNFKDRVIVALVIMSIVQITTIGYLSTHTHSAQEIIDTIFEDETGYLGKKLDKEMEGMLWGLETESNTYEQNDLLSKAIEGMEESQEKDSDNLTMEEELEKMIEDLETESNAYEQNDPLFKAMEAMENTTYDQDKILKEAMEAMDEARKEGN